MTGAARIYDLAVIGGGVTGCGIARDAAGRGLSVCLAERGDLAQATSSASTKLFHGGLRYLEYFDLRLVREALIEREVLLRAMPHIARPMRFVLPLHPKMRFENHTPAARLLDRIMPWMRGRRPAWLIRLGLLLYDNLGGRRILPGTRRLSLRDHPEGKALKDAFRLAYEYSDCTVDDARLVVLNARDAQARGAVIRTRTMVRSARREGALWHLVLEDQATGRQDGIRARMLINAAGPWVAEVVRDTIHGESHEPVRLVRGSHIVTRRLFDHDKSYFLQGRDGRIMFMIPWRGDFTLIDTTDCDHDDPDTPPVCTDAERAYMIAFVNDYLARPITDAEVVWSFSGMRPLHGDTSGSASATTRDYALQVVEAGGAPALHVFGGKITTYRRLAEAALARAGRYFPGLPGGWTADAPLPGGDFPVDGVEALIETLRNAHPFLDASQAARLVHAYGTEAGAVLGGAGEAADLGEDFGAGLHAREVDWLMDREWARTAEDVLWRRTKLGLHLDRAAAARIDAHLAARMKAASA